MRPRRSIEMTGRKKYRTIPLMGARWSREMKLKKMFFTLCNVQQSSSYWIESPKNLSKIRVEMKNIKIDDLV